MKFNSLLLTACLAIITIMPAAAIERNPYFGIGAGVSKLSPDVGISGLTLDEDTSTAVSVTLGMPVTQRFNAELGYSQLGTAELSNEDIAYSAFSLGAVAYVLGNDARINNQSGLRAYVRLGLNVMDNDTDVRLKEADNIAVWLGAGLEWPLTTRFSIRGELASFDGDAQAVTVALLFQPGAHHSRTPVRVNAPAVVPTPVVEPQPAIEPTPTIEPLPTPEPVIQPEPQAIPEPIIQPMPESEGVPTPEPTQTVIAIPKSGVLRGVEFESGTAILTTIGKNVLTQLAASMKDYSGLNIEIGAHTDGVRGDASKLALTRGRAIAVARHLAANGISIRRMKARSFGANKPSATGDSVGARRLNNRVEITVRQ